MVKSDWAESRMGSGGFSKARLARMREVMAGHVDRGHVPGLVLALSRHGEVHVEAIGSGSIGGAEPRSASPASACRIRRDPWSRTSWSSDPAEDRVAMLMTQRMGLPPFSEVYLDFWTPAYRAIDD